MTIPVLYHLGMPKTGTSLLQGTLARVPLKLRRRGVLYPRTGRAGVAHHAMTQILRDGDADARAAFLRDLRTEVDTSAADKGPPLRQVLLSSEGLVNLCGVASAGHLAEFMATPGEGFQGKAVIFLREVTSFHESMYFQTTRFRSVDRSFATYLEPRPQWMRNFLAGLTVIKDRMGDDFEIVVPGKGYDVLRAFELRLGLRPGFLNEPAAQVGSTVRPSLKGQTAMMHLDWVEERCGFAVDRLALAAVVGEGGVFEDDVAKFTIYAPGQRAKMAAFYIDMLEKAGFPDYAALSRALPAQEPPHHDIDRSVLTEADIDRLRSLRDRIAVDRVRPPRVRRNGRARRVAPAAT